MMKDGLVGLVYHILVNLLVVQFQLVAKQLLITSYNGLTMRVFMMYGGTKLHQDKPQDYLVQMEIPS